MNTYTVTFYLDDKQDQEMENLVTLAAAAGWKMSKQSIFEMMMKSGFDFLLEKKINFQKENFTSASTFQNES